MSQSSLPPHPAMPDFYATEDERRVRLMDGFDATAAHYDGINQLISFGTDGRYRRRALLRAGLGEGMKVLDAGCGTGMTAKFAKAIVGDGGCVVGVDPSSGMLDEAIKRHRVHQALHGIAEQLPVKDGQFDMVTMTYALRHVTDLIATFREFRRVLRPGGKVLILEMTTPQAGWRHLLLKAHVKHVVPALAMLRARTRAARWLYQYCWESHDRCARPQEIVRAMEQAGLCKVSRTVQLRIFSEYLGEKK